jgi:hypothetical protein
VRLVAAGTLTRAGRAGTNRVTFSGRIGRRALPVARYQATFAALNQAGRSKDAPITFRIVR